MKTIVISYLLAFSIFLAGCEKLSEGDSSSITDMSSSPSSATGGSSAGAGVITAGEWNDLINWDFWTTIIAKDTFKTIPGAWNIYPTERFSVHLKNATGLPMVDVPVALQQNNNTIFETRTDNKGMAELWGNLFTTGKGLDIAQLRLNVNNGEKIVTTLKKFSTGVNEIFLSAPTTAQNSIALSFVVDATGSMGDELRYLQTELSDVLKRAKAANSNSTVITSSVFYRDKGDEYITKVSPFTSNVTTTTNFINAQSADGGGDFPEAVDEALEKATNELQWPASARTRLLFLLLDAPPHNTSSIQAKLRTAITMANKKGIKIIPITASGIDKETEFLMRFFAIATNGTYVFITNHSGIGNTHITASVGKYEVEYLNNLLVRLINKYSE